MHHPIGYCREIRSDGAARSDRFPQGSLTMNLILLSRKFGKHLCDQHIVKLPLEAVQLLYTAWAVLHPDEAWREHAPYNKQGTARGYRATHINHPWAKWVRATMANYLFCADYAIALCVEYTRRYGKVHAIEGHARWLRSKGPPALNVGKFWEHTPFPLCVQETSSAPVALTLDEAIDAYRNYYVLKKADMARYTRGRRPVWLPEAKTKQHTRDASPQRNSKKTSGKAA